MASFETEDQERQASGGDKLGGRAERGQPGREGEAVGKEEDEKFTSSRSFEYPGQLFQPQGHSRGHLEPPGPRMQWAKSEKASRE